MTPQDPNAVPEPTTIETAAADRRMATAPPALDSAVERFAAAYLKDRRSERRWRIFFRLAWLGVVLVFATMLFEQSNRASVPSGPHTALVEVKGEIAVGADASAENLVAALKNAFEDKGARAVVLRINSPGGSPVQAGIVYDEIRRLKALHGKKVYVVVEEMCASGAYYIAAAADDIYADKASLVGSIGVLIDSFGFTGAMDRLGVERRLITAGENKGMLDPFSPLEPKQRAYAQQMIDQIHQQFIAVVKEGRGARLKPTPELFSGLFWNGQQALALGLVDRLGNLDYVAREVVKAETVIDYTQKENVAERLAKRLGASIGAGAVSALRQLAPLR